VRQNQARVSIKVIDTLPASRSMMYDVLLPRKAGIFFWTTKDAKDTKNQELIKRMMPSLSRVALL
jgi:hypothetical protein